MDTTFRCGRCRIWVGDHSKSTADIATADDNDLHDLRGSIYVSFIREPMRRGISLVSSSSHHALFIAEDSIRAVDVYCPSPFSMALVIPVDAQGTSHQQQCFLLSRVTALHANRSNTTTAEQEEEPTPSLSLLNIGDRVHMLDFLFALHGHLREVPLTSSARDLLAKKRIQEASTMVTSSKPTMPFRRRTISPTDFYGDKPKLVQQPSANPHTSTHSTEDSDSWRNFYARLQFTVSHSLLCQLEGTAPLSSSFPRQQEAFEFADQVTAFRARCRSQKQQQQQQPNGHSTTTSATTATTASSLDDPRVFCFEGANEGKRRFWVTTLRAFWREYTAIPHGSRHVYEIIREGTPCRLYFDLEFKKKLNPSIDGDALVSRLITLLQLQLYRQYHLLIDRDTHVVELESSTPDKFSRHLTIHLPNGALFTDNLHVGAFVKKFIHDLVASHQEATTTTSDFLVRDRAEESDPTQINHTHQLFIDTGVYTRNRMFRVLGSSKYRKTAVLRAMGSPDHQRTAASDGDGPMLDYDLFLRSIVCPGGGKTSQTILLRCEGASSLTRYWPSSGPNHHHQQQMRSVESRFSSFPALDAFIRSIATIGAIQGEIRAVHMLYPTIPVETETSSDHSDLAAEPVKIIYQLYSNFTAGSNKAVPASTWKSLTS